MTLWHELMLKFKIRIFYKKIVKLNSSIKVIYSYGIQNNTCSKELKSKGKVEGIANVLH